MPFGRVIHRAAGIIYVARTAGDGEFRAGEQFLRMMRARSLAEWKDAMRLRALVTSNYTYADRAGNIFYLWNTSLPWLPHPAGGDRATPVRETRDMWTRYVPFDELPQTLNPPGGYVHNENDSPHFANVRGTISTTNAYPNIEPPMLRLRSQHAISLIDNRRKFSLEDVIRLKHSYRMLLADRVKDDLVKAVAAARARRRPGRRPRAAAPAGTTRPARRAVAPRSSSCGGAVTRRGDRPPEQFAAVWSETDPVRTPRGLADPSRAAEALAWAAAEARTRYGRLDVAWGEIHRVRRGTVDVPVGGCSGALGCFRVLNFARDPADGKLVASSGDGWVLAVEFGEVPRAYSVLAYGESQRPESPWHADQAGMFARGEAEEGRLHAPRRRCRRDRALSTGRAAMTSGRSSRLAGAACAFDDAAKYGVIHACITRRGMAMTVRLGPRTERALNAVARRRGLSRSDVVREALEHYEAHDRGTSSSAAALRRLAGRHRPRRSWRQGSCPHDGRAVTQRRIRTTFPCAPSSLTPVRSSR